MKISVAKLAAALQDEGFSQDQILNFIAISRGESDFDVSGVNRGVEGGDEGDDSWGLFQINFAKGAAGDLRADALKIPTKADGLPTVAGLAKYFGLVRTKNKDGSKKTHSYKIKQGVSEEEVIAKNVAALKMMWNKEDYSAWSVHPDSPKFAGSQDAQDKWNGAATGRFANRQGNADFAEEFFKNEYGETVEFSDSDSLLGETEQPDNSANVGVFTPESSSEEDRTGPSMRELELEEEFEANRIAGNRDRQQEILEEIMEERERYTAERSGTLTPQQTESRSFNRDRFPDGSAVDFDLPPHLLESSTRLPNVLTQEMVDSLYQMYGGADYFMGREDMRIFTGLDGKPIKPTVVDGYTIEPGMNALLYAQVMGYEEENQVRAVLEQTEWYQSRVASARKFDVTWHELGGAGWEDGDEWSQDQINYLDDKGDELALMASRLGLDIEDPAVRNMLRDMSYRSMRLGMDKRDEKVELINALTEGLDPDRTPGLLESYEGTVESYERKWMVDLGEAATSDLAKELYYGDIDETVLNEQFKEQSINMYPSLRNLIESGYTPQSYFAPFKQKGEAILERPLDFMGGDNDLFIQLATGGMGEAGLQSPMALAQAGDYFRNRDEWRYTKNANDLSYDMAEQVITMFGGLGGQARNSGGYDSFSSFANMR
tara:strand:- start:478 stop:2457 length:1980 start_codon:yes stop_codon:yes gene_type:complete